MRHFFAVLLSWLWCVYGCAAATAGGAPLSHLALIFYNPFSALQRQYSCVCACARPLCLPPPHTAHSTASTPAAAAACAPPLPAASLPDILCAAGRAAASSAQCLKGGKSGTERLNSCLFLYCEWTTYCERVGLSATPLISMNSILQSSNQSSPVLCNSSKYWSSVPVASAAKS